MLKQPIWAISMLVVFCCNLFVFCLVNLQKLGKCACMGGDYFALNLKMGIDGLGFLVYNSGIKF